MSLEAIVHTFGVDLCLCFGMGIGQFEGNAFCDDEQALLTVHFSEHTDQNPR
jgi:hypothetical protein